MVRTHVPEKRVEVKARITEDLHARLVAECGECGCALNGFIAIAIAHEIADRKQRRQAAKSHTTLAGQLSLDGIGNVEHPAEGPLQKRINAIERETARIKSGLL